MHRSSIYTAGVLLLGASAFAQSELRIKPLPITSPIKDAGTLNLATGRWTRNAVPNPNATQVERVIIYNNTCTTGYFGALSAGHTWVDEGRLPSLSGPTVQWIPGTLPEVPDNGKSVGCADSYVIAGFQIGYCSSIVTQPTFVLGFRDTIPGFCPAPGTGNAVASFSITGLPASQTPGVQACWIISFDLRSPPQSVDLTFAMNADGNGTFDGPAGSDRGLDLFGIDLSIPVGFDATVGPIITSNHLLCAGYDGTVFDRSPLTGGDQYFGVATGTFANFPANNAFPPGVGSADVTNSEDGTGMNTFDAFRIDGGATPTPGCYFFGGNPAASFWYELYADVRCPAVEPGTRFCFPEENGINGCQTALGGPCPPGTDAPHTPGHGCSNSVNTVGAVMSASGNPIDGPAGTDTLVLTVTDEGNGLTIFIEGPTQSATGVIFGDGIRCVTGALKRFGQTIAVSRTASYPNDALDPSISDFTGAAAGQTKFYQAFYRNAAAWCGAATFNISSGVIILWQ
jgi:hypothetical protein